MISAKELSDGLKNMFETYPTNEQVAENIRKNMQNCSKHAQEFFAQKAVQKANAQRAILKDMVSKL